MAAAGILLGLFFCHFLLLASGNPAGAAEENSATGEHEALRFLHMQYAQVKHRLCNVKWKSHGFYCYRYFDSPRTFSDAEAECQSYGQHVHLASIASPLDRLFLMDLIESTEPDVWIGLRNVDGCSSWTWVDRTSYSKNHTSWADNEPDLCQTEPACVQLTQASKHYRWNDVGCTNKTGYICKTLAGNCS